MTCDANPLRVTCITADLGRATCGARAAAGAQVVIARGEEAAALPHPSTGTMAPLEKTGDPVAYGGRPAPASRSRAVLDVNGGSSLR